MEQHNQKVVTLS